MSNILDTKFQYYPSKVYLTEPMGVVTLNQLLNSIKNPKENIKEVFRKIRQATIDGDNDLKSKLKEKHLFYFTPSVISDGKGRKYENVVEYNELMVVEFDKIDFAKELKEAIFYNVESVIAGFTSPSGKGCKFIVRIPKPKNVDEYKEYFCGLAHHLDKIQGFDISNYNPLLPLFLSWDPDILIRKKPKIWTGRGEKINSFDFKNITISQTPKKRRKQSVDSYKTVLRRIDRMFDKITDNAHPQLVSNCLIVGGYVAGGYITESEAIFIINSKIESNAYMSKNVRGYKKTALEFIKEGQKSPIELFKS